MLKKSIALFILSYALLFSHSSAQQNENQKDNLERPFVLGKIFELKSDVLGEKRIINVYLPDGYNPSDTIHYPVIYLLDGSADEDFIHIAGLMQFCNFPWVKTMPPSILIGIANVDRKRDFTYPTRIEKDKKDFPTTGESAKFISFIEKELQPFVGTHLKTNSDKTIIGQSLGGLLATEILFKKPDLFNRYIIVSPSLWWDSESLLSLPLYPGTVSPEVKKQIYIAVGNEGEIMVSDAKKLVEKLSSPENKNMEVSYEYMGNEDHASILHEAVYRAFIKLYTKKENK
ncbi:MAG TPA: alpha/beta hydrolase-fold protein [Bacteroidia bacterium]|nr:alpha/beta hydrolase-fold protein [Bacteroidia bacterium]HNP99450.1 alpha/beta hydrolase-fold protein [Bacteroidia bacterium]